MAVLNPTPPVLQPIFAGHNPPNTGLQLALRAVISMPKLSITIHLRIPGILLDF
jgi:hypothetical protein